MDSTGSIERGKHTITRSGIYTLSKGDSVISHDLEGLGTDQFCTAPDFTSIFTFTAIDKTAD